MAVPTLSPGNGYSSAQIGALPANMPLPDPTQCALFFDEFWRIDAAAGAVAADWRALGSTPVAPTAPFGGAFGKVQLAPAGASDSTYLQYAGRSAAAAGSIPTNFTFVAGKEVFFETLFQISQATLSAINVGLMLPIAAAGDPSAAADGVFFTKASGSTSVTLRAIKTAGSTTNLTVATLADATDIKLGFWYDPMASNGAGAIQAFVNGSAVGSIPVTNMPTVGLIPIFGHTNNTAARTSTWDYVMAAQAR